MYTIKLFHRQEGGTLQPVSRDISMVDHPTMEMNQAYAKKQLELQSGANVVQLVLGERVVWEWPTPPNA